MSKKINFYTISLQRNDKIISYPIETFLNSIEEQMLKCNLKGDIVRRIGQKWIRLFPYVTNDRERQFVIPFGKLKDNNPFWLNRENHLEEIPAELYDINSLGYDMDYNIMVFTTNREGPNVDNVEEYLNTFIPEYTNIRLRIQHVMFNSGIEKVRNAALVKGVTFKLNLGYSLNNIYTKEIANNEEHPLIKALLFLAKTAKDDGDSKSLTLSLGMGRHGKKEDTLNIDSMLYLLERLNIEEECISEVRVDYKDGKDEKLDMAKLKESNLLLFYICKCDRTQVSPKDLLDNINDAVADKVIIIIGHNREFFSNIQQYHEEIDIVKNWSSNKS